MPSWIWRGRDEACKALGLKALLLMEIWLLEFCIVILAVGVVAEAGVFKGILVGG